MTLGIVMMIVWFSALVFVSSAFLAAAYLRGLHNQDRQRPHEPNPHRERQRFG